MAGPALVFSISIDQQTTWMRSAKVLGNKLGITNEVELAREEERLTKRRALELFDRGLLDVFEAGTFAGLAKIHGYLFQDAYAFAGKVRNVNIAKGNFRFAPAMYLDTALAEIDKMPQGEYDQIIEKYVEINVAHPFREGNGRSARIWLDCILRKEWGGSWTGASWVRRTTCLPWSTVPFATPR